MLRTRKGMLRRMTKSTTCIDACLTRPAICILCIAQQDGSINGGGRKRKLLGCERPWSTANKKSSLLGKRNAYARAWANLIINGYPSPDDMPDATTTTTTTSDTTTSTASSTSTKRRKRNNIDAEASQPSVGKPIPKNVMASCASSLGAMPRGNDVPTPSKQVGKDSQNASCMSDLTSDLTSDSNRLSAILKDQTLSVLEKKNQMLQKMFSEQSLLLSQQSKTILEISKHNLAQSNQISYLVNRLGQLPLPIAATVATMSEPPADPLGTPAAAPTPQPATNQQAGATDLGNDGEIGDAT
jgi:hypothetical protein